MARAAPPVRYPAGPAPISAWVLLVLATLWLVSLLAWAYAWGRSDLPGPWWVSLAAGAVLLLWQLWRQRHPVYGELEWRLNEATREVIRPTELADGAWYWHSAAYRQGVQLTGVRRVLAGHAWVLVRGHTPDGLGLWLWLQASGDPPSWGDLRRALQAHARR